jgi:Na+-driven multidrug efflux pump
VIAPLFAMFGGLVYLVSPHLGFDPDVGRNLAIYAGTLTAGAGLTAFWSVIPDSIVKAHHDTRSTMVAGILSNLTNVALNTLFLFVFNWGIFGIALSTVIGRLAGLAYAFWRARILERDRRRAWGTDVRPGSYDRPYRTVLVLGVPSALAYILMATESSFVVALLQSLPAAKPAVAAWAIYFRFVVFALTPMIAGSAALLPYVARHWGRLDVAAIRKGTRTLYVAALALLCLGVTPIYIGFSEPIVRAFIDPSSAPEAFALGVFSLRIAPVASLAAAPFLLSRPVFEGTQWSIPGMLMAFFRFGVLTYPCGWLGIRIATRLGAPGYHGLVFGLIAAATLCSCLFALWARRHLRSKEQGLTATGGRGKPLPYTRSVTTDPGRQAGTETRPHDATNGTAH